MFNISAKKTATPIVETKPRLRYPHRLNFYEAPPIDNVTLEDFETWAVDRLRVLAEIEASAIRDRTFDAVSSVVESQCEKHLPTHSNAMTSVDLDYERRKDHVSHFILRLAFCRSEELRQKFVKAETTLFRVRYMNEDKEDRQSFLASRKFGGEPISDDEKKQFKTQLMAATSTIKTDLDFDKETFFKVQWTKVTDLVAQRRVFIKAGYAYVPSTSQSSIIFQEFQARLTNALEMTARAIPRLDEDDRLLPIITHFSQGFLAGIAGEHIGGPEGGFGEAITKEMIDDLARKHFPMCMRNVHNALRRDQHMKHQGRLQYTLFLKVLGLPIEEAVPFWRQAYGSTMTDDKFNKEYKYNIRHSYGLEGKRANYPARSCANIISENPPGANESHGCPFRHFSTSSLQSALSGLYGISSVSQDMSDILNAVQAKQYHVACTRVFELTHHGEGIGEGESVSHPNKYAARSRELEREAEASAKAASAAESQATAGPETIATSMVIDEAT